jgi:hypothetical protein
MEVHFVRTGERRYGVTVIRKDQPAVERNSCPGYDPLIPHEGISQSRMPENIGAHDKAKI